MGGQKGNVDKPDVGVGAGTSDDIRIAILGNPAHASAENTECYDKEARRFGVGHVTPRYG